MTDDCALLFNEYAVLEWCDWQVQLRRCYLLTPIKRASLGAGSRREASDRYLCQRGNLSVVCSSSVFHEPALTRVSVPAFYRLDSSANLSCILCPCSLYFAQASSLELLPADPAVSLPSSPVSCPMTQKSPPENSKILLTCLSTIQHCSLC
ncbi:hypothetical protein ILYODFUR_031358 [Ilyodon furcidens]|uniref:Uncharacterized protein n=1 Tax=Ilyodon furcidens TaxID=33524 RepID=A0ABV0UY43_9TELE